MNSTRDVRRRTLPEVVSCTRNLSLMRQDLRLIHRVFGRRAFERSLRVMVGLLVLSATSSCTPPVRLFIYNHTQNRIWIVANTNPEVIEPGTLREISCQATSIFSCRLKRSNLIMLCQQFLSIIGPPSLVFQTFIYRSSPPAKSISLGQR